MSCIEIHPNLDAWGRSSSFHDLTTRVIGFTDHPYSSNHATKKVKHKIQSFLKENGSYFEKSHIPALKNLKAIVNEFILLKKVESSLYEDVHRFGMKGEKNLLQLKKDIKNLLKDVREPLTDEEKNYLGMEGIINLALYKKVPSRMISTSIKLAAFINDSTPEVFIRFGHVIINKRKIDYNGFKAMVKIFFKHAHAEHQELFFNAINSLKDARDEKNDSFEEKDDVVNDIIGAFPLNITHLNISKTFTKEQVERTYDFIKKSTNLKILRVSNKHFDLEMLPQFRKLQLKHLEVF